MLLYRKSAKEFHIAQYGFIPAYYLMLYCAPPSCTSSSIHPIERYNNAENKDIQNELNYTLSSSNYRKNKELHFAILERVKNWHYYSHFHYNHKNPRSSVINTCARRLTFESKNLKYLFEIIDGNALWKQPRLLYCRDEQKYANVTIKVTGFQI